MATARKEKSGNYRVRVYDYQDSNGKQHYKSFTAPTKKEAERMATQWAASTRSNHQELSLPLGDAMREYISDRRQSLSPRTISSYQSYMQLYYGPIIRKSINKITQADIQRCINTETVGLSPKTVRNVHGFLTAVMHTYRPDLTINTSLPAKKAPTLYIPSDADIHKLTDAIKGTYMELPVLLAAFGPMRRGEICALRAEDINGNVVHVCRNLVKSGTGGSETWIEKAPKTYSSDRYILFPDFVRESWERLGIKSGRLVTICPDTITKVFPKILQQNDIPHFRFHDLRHYSASIQHALGVPDAYIMQRGGWQTDTVLKQVYRHALDDKALSVNNGINTYFSDAYGKQHDAKHDAE